jgi:carnitine 3-dehydrogenase
MTALQPDQARRVGIVGAGVIGGGWALHYLRAGLDVDVYDPAPGARGDLLRMAETSWPLLERMGLREGASQDRLTFHDRLDAAVAGADVVQENAPEVGPVKRQVLADIDRATRPEVVIASSTSGFAMTMLQADCEHPERCVVGHPFNPPYLIPVVEVVGGERTDPAAVGWLADFYASTGKRPLRLSRELPGFVGNRLQEALWREALHMVAAGEATVEEIDASIAFGPGLRWALMGPCLTFHLAGGGGGMAHMLDHFGAALLEPWTRLQAPELTAELRERMIEGCLREADGRSVAELERLRDGFLAELLMLVERYSVETAIR